MAGWIGLTVAAVVAVWGVVAYNRLVLLAVRVKEGWSGIDVQLKRRFDLIPNLIGAVKGYAQYEKDTLSRVTALRSAAEGAAGPGERARAEWGLSRLIGGLLAVAEAYPDLKASTGFVSLQKSLSDTEEQIQYARRYYNATVRDNNVAVQSFPSALVARAFGFGPAEFFEVELAQKQAPEVKL
jgi:LemA protein